MQHIFGGDEELYWAIHRQFNDLRTLTRRTILRVVKRPLPLLGSNIDDHGVIERGCRGLLIIEKSPPDE